MAKSTIIAAVSSACLLLVTCSATIAQTSASAPVTAQSFLSPPDTAKPLTWWHWVSGNVTSEGIDADLVAMKQIGLGGAQIFSVDQGPAGPVRYMSPQWRRLVQHAIKKAHSLGLKLSITDCEGWSESGGPWITPQLSMQKVVWTEDTVIGGDPEPISLKQPESYQGYYKDVAVLAFPAQNGDIRIADIDAKAGFTSKESDVTTPDPIVPRDYGIDPNKILDLSAKLTGNTLKWTPPPGSWTILRFGMTSTGTPIHPAMPQTVGLECDKLSKAAVTANWNGDLARVIAESGPNAGATLGTVLMDSWEAGTGNWTPLMPHDFEALRGYDLIPWLPALTGRIVVNTDLTERFLWDYRRTMADLVAQNHYGLIRSLAHAHGMQLQAEAVGIGMPTVADELLCKGNTDIPMGEFWIGNPWTLTDDKEAASAAHIYDKQIVAAESFTSIPDVASWTNDPFSIKALGDDAFCTGVNRMSIHRYAMQPYLNRYPGMTMGPWGLNFERTNTWWGPGKAWISYITRCQYLLQQGKFVGDICYFYGEGAPQDVGGFQGSPPPPPGYASGFCNTDVLLHRMSVKNGRIVLPDGMSYQVLVLPEDTRLTPDVVSKINDFVSAGATVVGPKPTESPSLMYYPYADGIVQNLAQQVWANCDGTTITHRKFGMGEIFWGQPLDQILAAVGPDFTYTSDTKSATLRYIHRRSEGDDYYFVSNQNYMPVDAVCTFRVTNRTPELWWPDSGRIETAPSYTIGQTHISVPIHFDSAGSVFVVFRSPLFSTPHITSTRVVKSAPAPSASPHQIHIISASYGVITQSDVTGRIAAWLSAGEPQLVVGNGLDNGTDPNPNVVKELDVDYTVAGKRYSTTIGEGALVGLPFAPAGTHDVVILSALYGTPGVVADTSSQVAALVAEGGLSIPASNSINRGNDPAPNIVKALVIDYTADGVEHKKRAREGSSIELVEPPPDAPPIIECANGSVGQPGINAWENGTYQAELSNGSTKILTFSGVPAAITFTAPWELSFPAGLGAPAHVRVNKLASWTTMPYAGVKYFSGTATYNTRLMVAANQLGPAKRLYLDLGVVKNLADVTINGHELGVIWKAPFRLDITGAVAPGVNTLQVKVTNLWPNRLIGDSALPENKRFTWTTYNPYNPDSELLDSGLIGPVVLRSTVWKPVAGN